jgi:2-oxoglutarate dehydrogenase E2 component (dihydrolipoamide succinyltransferase)
MRRRIAAHMVESLLQTAPHVTTVFEADLTAVLAHRARARPGFDARGVPLTLTADFVAACVDAIRAVPEANARWTDDAILVNERIDIGVGTALPGRGLVVPVIRDVARLDLAGIATALGELVARAREDHLTPADLQGGSFTISNHGVSGSLVAAPIVINQPQSAILGIGRLEKRAVVVAVAGGDEIVIQPRCYLTLTIDHRVLDGHQANQFMQTLVGRLEAWR